MTTTMSPSMVEQAGTIDTVIYHDPCSDGFAAAFAAWMRLGDKAQYFPVAHRRDMDAQAPDVTGKRVAVLDITFSVGKMKQMIEESEFFVVLDHHASAEKALASVSEDNKVFEGKQSGCTLAWNLFHPSKEIPLLFRYIEDKDIWRWGMKESKAFTASWSMLPMDFETYKNALTEGSMGIWKHISAGRMLLKYRQTLIDQAVKTAQPRRLKRKREWKAKVVNNTLPLLISEIGDALVQQDDCDVALLWSYDHKQRVYRGSMRSGDDDHDVSKVCSDLGGGGHKRAGGFAFTGNNIEELFE